MKYKHSFLTEKIIQSFYTVYNNLGYGFLEKVYENAMMIELNKIGLQAKAQSSINVKYNDKIIGEYFADIVIDNKVIIELKAKKILIDKDEAQLLNYLKATKFEVGLLLNYGPEPEIKRKAFDNENK